jgi:hypothetical protein
VALSAGFRSYCYLSYLNSLTVSSVICGTRSVEIILKVEGVGPALIPTADTPINLNSRKNHGAPFADFCARSGSVGSTKRVFTPNIS